MAPPAPRATVPAKQVAVGPGPTGRTAVVAGAALRVVGPGGELVADGLSEADALRLVFARTPRRRPVGFLCPDCGVRLRTLKTYQSGRNLVTRRRRCPGCGWRLTTHERPAPVTSACPSAAPAAPAG